MMIIIIITRPHYYGGKNCDDVEKGLNCAYEMSEMIVYESVCKIYDKRQVM